MKQTAKILYNWINNTRSKATLDKVFKAHFLNPRNGHLKDSRKRSSYSRSTLHSYICGAYRILNSSRILLTADPSVFASLQLLNRAWRSSAQQSKILAHQLSRCPFYTLQKASTLDALSKDNLPKLQRIFNSEVKRNLYTSYLRPKETIVELISTSVSSSAAFPGGEALQFCFSPQGSIILAISSSRIYLIDATSKDIKVTRELKILRRPASADVLDDGSFLAVLSTDHQVNLYDLRSNAKHTRLVQLDNPPRTIALAPGGSVLAAAYDGGIEVYSLSATAMSTDRRAVKCDPVDSLSFSIDGTMLLGTTRHSPTSNTVVLSAPYYHEGDEDVPPSELLSQMWTTQILFPNNSRDCSHATLLPQAFEGDTGWTFTYDRVFETFRAVRVDDLRNGTMYFTGPFSAESDDAYSLPSTLPTANAKGEVAAAGFAGKEIWLYGIPEDLEVIPDSNPLNGVESEIGSLSHSSSLRRDRKHEVPSPSTNLSLTPTGRESSTFRLPQWQVLCDKFKNVFLAGQHLASVDGISGLRWVKRQKGTNEQDSPCDRLIAVAPGIVSPNTPNGDESETLPADGGRIVIYDFERGTCNGLKREITIELGDLVPEVLEEERRDMEAEVAIVRRRTVAKSSSSLGRSRGAEPTLPSARGNVLTARSAMPPTSASVRSATGRPSVRYSREAPDVQLEGPYTPGDPRSRSLLRAATVASNAATSRNRRNMTGGGPHSHRDPPHESDADNWTPPPPPYTEDSAEPLPDHLLLTLLPRHTMPIQRVSPEPTPGPVRAQTNLEAMASDPIQRSRTTAASRPGTNFERESPPAGRSSNFGRSSSNVGTPSTRQTEPVPDLPGELNVPSAESNPADLYEITPPSSPAANRASSNNTGVLRAGQLGEQESVPNHASPESDSVDQRARNPNLHEPSRQEDSGPLGSMTRRPTGDSNMGRSPFNTTQPAEASKAADSSILPTLTRSSEMENSGPSESLTNLALTLPPQDGSVTANFSRVQPADPVNLQSDSRAHLIPEKPTAVRPRRSSSLQDHQRPDVQQLTQLTPQKSTGRKHRSSNRSRSPSKHAEEASVGPISPALLFTASAEMGSSNAVPIVTSAHSVESTDLDAPIPPSPEQMAALQSRYSSDQPRRRPASISRQAQNAQAFYNPNAQISTLVSAGSQSAQPQNPYLTPYNPISSASPPRAAAGAAGQSQVANNSPHRSSSGRNNSRSPLNSRSPSSSTPNVSRPDLRRLDTIHSITSQHSEQLLSAASSTTGATSTKQSTHPPRTSHGGDVYLSTSQTVSNPKGDGLNKPLPQLQNQQQQQYLKRPRWRLGRGKSDGSASGGSSTNVANPEEESWEEVTRKWKIDSARNGGYEKKKRRERGVDGDRDRARDGKCLVM